jgi:hypothetical protein
MNPGTGFPINASIFNLWLDLLSETTSGLFLQLLKFGPVSSMAHGLAKLAFGAQNTSFAPKW